MKHSYSKEIREKYVEETKDRKMFMSRDEMMVQQVEDKLDGKESSHAYTAEVTMKRVGGPDPSASLEELERNAEIARARYLYATEKKNYWHVEEQRRSVEFTEANITYYKKKHKISDEQLDKTWNQDYLGIYEKEKI